MDLTNTKRFYDSSDIEKEGARYVKLKCRGHGECPNQEQVTLFTDICEKFIRKTPLEIIGELNGFCLACLIAVEVICCCFAYTVQQTLIIYNEPLKGKGVT